MGDDFKDYTSFEDKIYARVERLKSLPEIKMKVDLPDLPPRPDPIQVPPLSSFQVPEIYKPIKFKIDPIFEDIFRREAREREKEKLRRFSEAGEKLEERLRRFSLSPLEDDDD